MMTDHSSFGDSLCNVASAAQAARTIFASCDIGGYELQMLCNAFANQSARMIIMQPSAPPALVTIRHGNEVYNESPPLRSGAAPAQMRYKATSMARGSLKTAFLPNQAEQTRC
jgi:hypothetical protein